MVTSQSAGPERDKLAALWLFFVALIHLSFCK
jgi:hypothetical protein